MKKSYFITFILIIFGSILSFFFSTAYADTLATGNITLSGSTYVFNTTNFTTIFAGQGACGSVYPTNLCQINFYAGTYPDTSSFLAGSGSMGLGSGVNWSTTEWTQSFYGVTSPNFWVQWQQGGVTAYQQFSYGSGIYNIATITLSDGINTQITPASGSTVAYNTYFTGTYTNVTNHYSVIIVNTTTGTPAIYSSASASAETGSSLPYSINLLLTPNQNYSYTMQLCMADGYTCSTPTAPISFSTSALLTTITSSYTPATCDWTSPSTYGGCISNIFYALFYPSSESLTQFSNLYTTYRTKPPFGYISAIQTTLGTINDTGTAIFSLQSLPILDTYIFNPLKLALTWILWLGFAFLLFKRFKDIQL